MAMIKKLFTIIFLFVYSLYVEHLMLNWRNCICKTNLRIIFI